MRRKFSPRERIIFCLLCLVAISASYISLFYTPMITQRDKALSEKELCDQQYTVATATLANKVKMEEELDIIFSENSNPPGLAPYDNQEAVIEELNSIMSSATNYSLSFSPVDTGKTIVRREVSVNYTCSSYAAAKAILQQLQREDNRCCIGNLTISRAQTPNGPTSVTAGLMFFEYIP